MRVRRALLLGLMFLAAAPLPAADGWYDDYARALQIYRQADRTEDYQAVATLCRQALAQQPPARREGDVWFLYGRAAYDADDSAAAVTALREALARRPESAEVRLWLGYAYQLDGRTTLAVDLFFDLVADPAADAAAKASALEWLESLHESPATRAMEPAEQLVVPGVILRYHRGEPFAARVREALSAARQKLLDELGIEVVEPIEVILFRDAAEYQAYHRARELPRPEWSTACTSHGRIFTYPAAGERDGLLATLTHEYTHVALRAYADDRTLPCWIDEGAAVVLSGQFPGHRAELRQSRSLLTLDALMVPSFGAYERADARLAYLQSKAMVEDLWRVKGAVRFRAYLRELGRGGDPVAAFEQVFGVAMDEYHRWWVAERVDG